MKDIVSCINESLLESADKVYTNLFGREIMFSDALKTLYNKVGMSFMHEYDRFVVYEDGSIEYNNEYLFTGTIHASVNKAMLNRIISPQDIKKIKLDASSVCCYKEADDKCHTPLNLLRAVLNALTMKSYTATINGEIVINSLDYTKGDFTKDECEENND